MSTKISLNTERTMLSSGHSGALPFWISAPDHPGKGLVLQNQASSSLKTCPKPSRQALRPPPKQKTSSAKIGLISFMEGLPLHIFVSLFYIISKFFCWWIMDVSWWSDPKSDHKIKLTLSFLRFSQLAQKMQRWRMEDSKLPVCNAFCPISHCAISYCVNCALCNIVLFIVPCANIVQCAIPQHAQ